MIENISVHKARMRMGVTLGEKILRERPDHDIDVVIPIPDTSRDSAMELANVLGVKYREGFVKNRYVGRTFIMPGQGERVKSVKRKLNAIPLEFRNRVVLLVDDSIVRGTLHPDRADGARRRRAQGLPGLGRAAGALPEHLRHRHAVGGGTGRQRPQRDGDRTDHRLRLAAVPGPARPGSRRGRTEVPRHALRQLVLQRRVRDRHRAGLLRTHPAAALGRGEEEAAFAGVVSPRIALVGAASAASFAPSPAKAWEGWGGVPLGSARTVGTPSQPPPAFAGGGRSEE